MNDGEKPKRSILSYILPYLMMAVTVGLFIWLLVSQMNTGAVWKESNLDAYFGYTVVKEESSYKYTIDESAQKYKITSYTVSQGYKAVTISGTYKDNTSQRDGNFSVLVEEERWNNNFDVVVKRDNNVITLEHVSYASLFSSDAVFAIALIA